jgi:hypothetical protein
MWKCHEEIPCIVILNKQECHFFFFLKIRGQEGGTGFVRGGGVDTSGRGEGVGKGCRKVNMVQILCVYVNKWKNKSC